MSTIKVGDSVAIPFGPDDKLRIGVVRRVFESRVWVSSEPDPCSPGFDIETPHWSSLVPLSEVEGRTGMVEALRAAGADAWDKINDPKKYLDEMTGV